MIRRRLVASSAAIRFQSDVQDWLRAVAALPVWVRLSRHCSTGLAGPATPRLTPRRLVSRPATPTGPAVLRIHAGMSDSESR